MTETASFEELIWVVLVAIGLLFALWAVRDTWGDYVVQSKRPGSARHKIARATLRRAVSYAFILSTGLLLGLQALYTPPRPSDPASDTLGFLIPLGFILIMLVLVGEIVMDRLTRREVLADLARFPSDSAHLVRERDSALAAAVELREDIVDLRAVVVRLDERLNTFQGGLDMAHDRVEDARDELGDALHDSKESEDA